MQLESVETATESQRRWHDEHKRRQARFVATARDHERGKTIQIIQEEPASEPVPATEPEQEYYFGIPVVLEKQDEPEIRPIATCELIKRAVCKYFRITLMDIVSERRDRYICRPRMVAFYLCRKLTTNSFPQIGRKFGDRDHTTVLNGIRRIEELRAIHADINAAVESISSQFANPTISSKIKPTR